MVGGHQGATVPRHLVQALKAGTPEAGGIAGNYPNCVLGQPGRARDGSLQQEVEVLVGAGRRHAGSVPAGPGPRNVILRE